MDAARKIIEELKLEPHPEGGYFRRTYESAEIGPVGSKGLPRPLLSCIYYLLTRDSPIGRLHVNRSDIMHFYHGGAPIVYTLVSPDGELRRETLGPDPDQSQAFQLLVPGGWWKASELASGDYGLISEAVSPGFDYEDMRFVSPIEAASRFPQLGDSLSRLCRIE